MDESIFDYGRKMGLPYVEGDYWDYDRATATWARVIVVPRKEFYHPNEGLERSAVIRPILANLRDLRLTIPLVGKAIKDNWRKAEMHESPTSDSKG